MRIVTLSIAAGLLTCGSLAAQAQPNPVQGSPGSLFPDAAPNEVQIINGVPCRTVLIKGSNLRVPVQCAGPVATGTFEPSTTGSIRVEAGGGRMISGRPLSGTPNAFFPDAAPNEVQIINGVPCRTVLVQGSNLRLPVACAR